MATITNIYKRTFGIIYKQKVKNFKVHKIYNKSTGKDGILSTCLYGNTNNKKIFDKYVRPLLKNIYHIKKYLPNWVYRVYLDPSISKNILQQLVNTKCEVYVMNKPSNGHEGSMWRFLPAQEDLPFISLDADDICKKKITEAFWVDYIEPWLKSDKQFFQHKCHFHNAVIPITAKYWGCKPGSIPNIDKLIDEYSDVWYGCDEAMLAKHVYPMLKTQGVYVTPFNLYEILFSIFLMFLMWGVVFSNKKKTYNICMFLLILYLYIKIYHHYL